MKSLAAIISDREYREISSSMTSAQTAEQFDDAVMRMVLFLQQHIPNQKLVARCIGAFIRGLLEGTGYAAPWLKPGTDFLEQLYAMHERGETDAALDLIFKWVDTELKTSPLAIDEVLRAIDVNKLDEDLLVGLLSATFAGKGLLASRASFTERCHARLTTLIGAELTDALLRDLGAARS